MSLIAMVYYVLLAECVLLLLLLTPYARNVVVSVGSYLPIQSMKWYVMASVAIVAFMSEETLRRMYKLQGQRSSLDPNDVGYLAEKEALMPPILRAQRDSYICGFALFFCFIIPLTFTMARDLKLTKQKVKQQ
eukprot:CFRG4279T1